MNSRIVRCTLCQGIIQESERVTRQGTHSLCTTCVDLSESLDHRHTLSIDLFSLEDVNTLTAQLFRVSNPTTCNCISSHSGFSRGDRYEVSYCLSCTYKLISLELLELLSSLRVRFTLRDMVTQQEALSFWPSDTVPQGVLMSLVIRAARTPSFDQQMSALEIAHHLQL